MRINEIGKYLDTNVYRDGTFDHLGLISSKNTNHLVYLETEHYLTGILAHSGVSAVVTTLSLAPLIPQHMGVCISDEPKRYFYSLHHALAQNSTFYGESFESEVDESATIHPTAFIASSNVRIGARAVIGPKACILENSWIEEDVVIGPGSIIGSEGFGFNKVAGHLEAIQHTGGVRIERHAEIQANCCIDKAMFGGFTNVGANTKLDNLVYVAHNARIGKECLIAAHACIAGSVTIGDHVWIGPNSTIIHELSVGDHASVSVGSVVTKNVPAGARVTGNFAIDHSRYLNFLRSIRS